MFSSLYKTIRAAYSGDSAKNFVTDLSRFHRIQASPGYRAAAQYVQRQLADLGLETEVITFPARYDVLSWSSHHFQEWSCEKATLRLIEPTSEARTLADFRAQPMSIIQRSAPFNGELEVVVLDDGTRADDYANVDVAGKMVFTCKPIEAVRDLAIEQHGAVGILSDWLAESQTRARWDLPDALQYTSFWWTGHERRVCGFVLTPREGEKLRALIKKENAAGRAVRVHAEVVSRLYDGAIEAITALLPGSGDEEVVVVGHLCHPAPGGNDNASGAAATMEAARALQVLIESGQLPTPKRSLRFLWIPEMTGTYAYLARREQDLAQLIAGVNLDMVGANQELCGSSFLIDAPPEATASFALDLLEAVREAATQEVGFFSGGAYALFRYATTPFGGGSDHYIFSDPSVGVPMPMLIQWPDKFYHTSADTLDKVDPRMLGIIGSVATTYAYWLANADDDGARRLGELMTAKGKQRIIQVMQREKGSEGDKGDAENKGKLEEIVAYRVGREQAALETLKRLSPTLEVSGWMLEIGEFAERELARIKSTPTPIPTPTELEERAARMIPVRMYKGPIALRGHVAQLSQAERAEFNRLGARAMGGMGVVPTLAVYWADGKRTVLEIAKLVELECGKQELEFIVAYFEWLAKMRLITLHTIV